jgi:drug/metabolite transporter (DMT)-like permease
MLGTASPIVKQILQQGDVAPLELACSRVLIAFVVLFVVTLLGDRDGISFLTGADFLRLTCVGFLGVGFYYAVGAWALLHTTVTHYILIYSLNPSFTALLSFAMKKDHASAGKICGIGLSFAGGIISVTEGFHHATLGSIGAADWLVLLSTALVSLYIVLSSGIVKRYGPQTANTVMFGTSFLLLLVGTLLWSDASLPPLSPVNGSLILYLGIATAAAFLLRYLSLQSLTPATVGAFHNLVPVCAILLAYLLFDEPVESHTIIGGVTILTGVELVRRS